MDNPESRENAELEAQFARQMSYVRSYDVGINSLLAAFSSLIFLGVDLACRLAMRVKRLFKR